MIRESRDSDIPALRKLINEAYKELADLGLNYTATYQDENKTRERISEGKCFVFEDNGNTIATILFTKKNYFTNKNTAYVGQFAVSPLMKKNGIGTQLMNYCEMLAQELNFDGLQLDTAQPASHLVNWYLKMNYKIVGETQWDGKTYKSFIFEKLF